MLMSSVDDSICSVMFLFFVLTENVTCLVEILTFIRKRLFFIFKNLHFCDRNVRVKPLYL